MADTLLFANNARSTLAGSINAAAVTCTLASGTGVLFPNPGAGQYFVMTFVDVATGLQREIVWVTGRTGDVLTIVRGREGTAAQSWTTGDIAAALVTAGVLQSFVQNVALYPARIVTTSGVTAMTSADGAIGFQRTAGLGASSVTLPADAFVGQVFEFSDLVGNFAQYPLTINPPVGMTIANLGGSGAYVCQVNRMTARVKYFGSNVWSLMTSGG